MLCPRCHTGLPDSATTCSQCGSSVSALQPETPTFSYLPAGTPQWPTTSVPPAFPYPAPGSPQAYQQGITGAPFTPAASDRSASKRGPLSAPVILLLFIVSILIGGGLTYGILALQGQTNASAQKALPTISLTQPAATTTTQTPTTGATGTTSQLPAPTSFKTGTSSDLAFSMQYPSDWVQEQPAQSTSGNKDIAFHPQEQLPVYLQVGQISAANSATVNSSSDVNQANIDGFGTNYGLSSPTVLTDTPTTRSVGGASWSEEDANFTASDNTVYHVVSLTVKHTKYYYNILYFAPSTSYDDAMSKYYTQMLSSFQFTA